MRRYKEEPFLGPTPLITPYRVGWMILLILCVVLIEAWAGYSTDTQIVIFLQRADYTDDEIADFMTLPRYGDVSDDNLLGPGRQLWVRDDLRVAIVFYFYGPGKADGQAFSGCYQTKVLYDYTGSKK